MLLWLMFAGLTAAALAFVLRPVFAATEPQPAAVSPELAAYTAQLADLDAQVAQGRLDPAEYDALRHEVSRRILRLDPPSRTPQAPHAREAQPPRLAFAAAAAVPLATLALYAWLGRPNIEAHPSARNQVPTAATTGADLVAAVEARIAKSPDDPRGWELIAPIYLRMERFADAADAFQHLLTLSGDTPQRLAAFAEATVMANDGIVTDAARAAYEKLAVVSPDRFEPRFWLALAKEQDGQRAAAAAEYQAMLKAAPTDAPWRKMVEQRLAAVTSAGPSPRGPRPSDVEAASNLTAEQRTQMISGMVDGLAARLKANGADAEGWQRLISSYVTLKQPDKARVALRDAQAALAANTSARAALEQLANRLGLTP